MKQFPFIKTGLCLFTLVLTACELPFLRTIELDKLPPLPTAFNCLPANAAFIAAHRGTSYDSRLAENSLGGLKALMKRGYFFSEIDVARLKDRTHILMHDGVFDRTTVTKGVVAAAAWSDIESALLKDQSGRVTSDTVPKLEDYLKQADQQIYLEIDFKSSASYAEVIDLIRKTKMQNHVILIAYTNNQARKLSQLAPEMIISVPIKHPRNVKTLTSASLPTSQIAAWVSRNELSKALKDSLAEKNIPVLKKAPTTNVTRASREATILVDNYAFQLKPIMGLSRGEALPFQNCMQSAVDTLETN